MSSNPRNQAEALTFAKKQAKDLQDKKLFESESETLEFLHWAELPVTNEGDARGLAYSMRFLRVLEKLVESYKDRYNKIQTKKQKGD